MSLWSENEVRVPEPIKYAGHRDVDGVTVREPKLQTRYS